MTRICIVGHSAAGKSTTAALIATAVQDRGMSCAVVKIAAPLYELQTLFYRRIGVELPQGQQDQRLLENLATHIREISPHFLINDFLGRTDQTVCDVVVNDDVRSWDVDLPRLRDAGWITLRISTTETRRQARLSALGFVSRSDKSTACVEQLSVDYDLRNDGAVTDLADSVCELLDKVM